MTTLRKHELLNRLVDKPLEFSQADFDELLGIIGNDQLTFQDIRAYVCRIFDINDSILLESSTANNFPNRFSQRRRNKKFYAYFRKGRKNFEKFGNKVIVAEGDSWFEFPFFIKDIIDHLSRSFKIYSLAYGGDWLTNIVYEGKYIEKLSVFNPDVFLVSGGGNDLVGSDRLGIMVRKDDLCIQRYADKDEILARVKALYPNDRQMDPTEQDLTDFMRAQKHTQPAFYSFVHIMKLQYALIFRGIHRKFPKLRIITQAYDYAIPSPKFHGFLLHNLVNRLLGTGRWLYLPLMINGITEPQLQRQLIRYMIFQFNLMSAEIARSNDNVFHIDCRGVARQDSDWYDELHLKSSRFKVIANAYTACINSTDRSKKIYFAREYDTNHKQQP